MTKKSDYEQFDYNCPVVKFGAVRFEEIVQVVSESITENVTNIQKYFTQLFDFARASKQRIDLCIIEPLIYNQLNQLQNLTLLSSFLVEAVPFDRSTEYGYRIIQFKNGDPYQEKLKCEFTTSISNELNIVAAQKLVEKEYVKETKQHIRKEVDNLAAQAIDFIAVEHQYKNTKQNLQFKIVFIHHVFKEAKTDAKAPDQQLMTEHPYIDLHEFIMNQQINKSPFKLENIVKSLDLSTPSVQFIKQKHFLADFQADTSSLYLNNILIKRQYMCLTAFSLNGLSECRDPPIKAALLFMKMSTGPFVQVPLLKQASMTQKAIALRQAIRQNFNKKTMVSHQNQYSVDDVIKPKEKQVNQPQNFMENVNDKKVVRKYVAQTYDKLFIKNVIEPLEKQATKYLNENERMRREKVQYKTKAFQERIEGLKFVLKGVEDQIVYTKEKIQSEKGNQLGSLCDQNTDLQTKIQNEELTEQNIKQKIEENKNNIKKLKIKFEEFFKSNKEIQEKLKKYQSKVKERRQQILQ
ncbi:Hypothetical_protein [Hexamita inflata]|uniref:Hypothetical_protein n=1 Tax=Hexamita inflata TaxID=28002 RepID=A0AA86NC11_9EUKA|nr:Hypothetical protein HINF_LOCUS4602 [Hexamita inflata]CAI9965052.1 Hypothetical protein HINF_LOCUS52697 [Hexamita inflata]